VRMDFKELFEQFPRGGNVVWIGIRPDRKVPLIVLESVTAIENQGLSGDRHKKKGGIRQVTLIQKEHLDSIAKFLKRETIDPQLTRRNLVVQGLNLLSLKGRQFKIGEVILEYSGDCHPCSRMEENLGEGGYNAMRGLGGITAKVVKSGEIHLNSSVTVI
jgi:MOSC domain-containing protein YiiM